MLTGYDNPSNPQNAPFELISPCLFSLVDVVNTDAVQTYALKILDSKINIADLESLLMRMSDEATTTLKSQLQRRSFVDTMKIVCLKLVLENFAKPDGVWFRKCFAAGLSRSLL